ncbi:uncharacterized protein LOC113557983 [Rhopalosiphum maidis]|uniref:uncharacterized protein LOC113557983 n=1 Tax=Rhopalosiphum maidis TaxID=43146 RepID=UPI00101DFC9D|nr:uncharacterized protein LOC113557983 [Rhopalosiphum maidis]
MGQWFRLGAFKTVFNEEQENQLVTYIKTIEAQNDLAGLDWMYNFMKRHPDLSIRKPEATSAAQASGFNPTVVGKFYILLSDTVDTHKLQASQIYNVDETSITCIPKLQSKIVACSERRQVGALTSTERGQTVTVEICKCDGLFMPPMLIFLRVRSKPELIDGAPLGYWAEVHPSGWIQTRDAGVILLYFPPHCTHKLQPLDEAFMKPLSIYQSLLGKAYLKASTMTTAINGFRATGCIIKTTASKDYDRIISTINSYKEFERTKDFIEYLKLTGNKYLGKKI